MRSILKIFAVLAIFVLCMSAAHAATYGYASIKGKRLESLRREVQTIKMLVKDWPNGEVLATIESSSGFVFKKHEIVVVFAGNSREITTFLTKAPYEGDFIKNVEVSYNFGNYKNKAGEKVAGNFITTRKYPNVRKALEANLGKSAKQLWKKLHKNGPNYQQVEAVVTFYSMRVDSDNKIFRMTEGEGLVKSVPMDLPMIPGSF